MAALLLSLWPLYAFLHALDNGGILVDVSVAESYSVAYNAFSLYG
jgi:hypothetical protein